MNNNIPTELVTELATLADRIEQAIRKDERRKVREQLLEKISAETGQQRRGLYRGDRGKDKRKLRSGTKLQALYRALHRRNYPVTRVTLQRESGLEGWAFYEGIATLRQRGFDIKTLRTGRPKPKYQLAS